MFMIGASQDFGTHRISCRLEEVNKNYFTICEVCPNKN